MYIVKAMLCQKALRQDGSQVSLGGWQMSLLAKRSGGREAVDQAQHMLRLSGQQLAGLCSSLVGCFYSDSQFLALLQLITQ